MPNSSESLSLAAERAVEWVKAGDIVGLGTGRAAEAFIRALAKRVHAGLRIRGVPTSEVAAMRAKHLGIPLTSLDEVEHVEVTVDGADEIDPQLNLIKGLGGALVREKIVAAASRRLLIIAGADKLVQTLGERGILPIEVVPFGLAFCRRRLAEIGYPPTPRVVDGRLFVTDNGNHLLDCRISLLCDPQELDWAIRTIPGVVGTGLFLGMADTVLIQDGQSVEVRQRTV